MDRFDTLIVNGHIIDGTGAAGYNADIGIVDGRVAAIGKLSNRRAANVIDATGRIVAPGHVTQHSHYDAALFWDPYCSNSGEHGVTTLVNANCGFGFAPVREEDRERTMRMMETTEQIPMAHQRAGMPWDWVTFPEFLDRVRALPKGVNVLTYLPLNPLLVYVMGIEAAKTRRPTAPEIARMHELINEAMDAGAIGISMSVMGLEGNSHLDSDGTAMPTDLLHPDDVVEISRAVADRGEGLIQMLSQIAFNGDRNLTARVAEMARGTGARVVHNVFASADSLPDMPRENVAWIESLRARGLDVVAGAILNRGWVEAGIADLDTAAGQLSAVREIVACQSDEERRALIADPAFAERFWAQYSASGPTNGAGGFENQLVIEVGDNPELEPFVGRKLVDIAQASGRNVVEALLDLGVRSNLKVQFKSEPFAAADPSQLLTYIACPAIALGVSDGGAHTKAFGNGHYGTEFLISLVREQKLLSLEELHFQLALKPARTMMLQDRGALCLGMWADVLIYDLDALYLDTSRFEILYDMPDGDWRRNPRAGGYDWILVNGVVTHRADASTGATPGDLLSIASEPMQLRAAA